MQSEQLSFVAKEDKSVLEDLVQADISDWAAERGLGEYAYLFKYTIEKYWAAQGIVA